MAEITGSDLALVLKAASFSADRHRHQKRKGDDPAALHQPSARSGQHPREHRGHLGRDDPRRSTLHDTVEDTSATPEELESDFGREVRLLVEEVTDDKELDKAERKRLQIEHTPSLSTAAKQIKLGDKICNMRDVVENPPTDWSLQRRRDYLDWAELVVAGCRGANERLEQHFDRLLAGDEWPWKPAARTRPAHDEHYVYLYRDIRDRVRYVGYGRGSERASSHLTGSHNECLNAFLGAREYRLEIAGPFGTPRPD